jgi:hypothetical protein
MTGDESISPRSLSFSLTIYAMGSVEEETESKKKTWINSIGNRYFIPYSSIFVNMNCQLYLSTTDTVGAFDFYKKKKPADESEHNSAISPTLWYIYSSFLVLYCI